MTIATFFTILRVLAIPVFIVIYYSGIPGARLIASGIFILACLTDWLDGYLARKLDQCSKFGAFLDPVADKLLVTVSLVMLAANFTSPWFVAPAAIMVAREILISALREWMSAQQQRDKVAVGWIGKVKTTAQMLAIIILLAANPDSVNFLLISGYILIYIAAVLTLWSMFSYLKNAWPSLRRDIKNKSPESP
ncbi:MAG: CDP-diacylglycerol--glycerol-3-phosphate 3-phosphatidyltransferase [Gammaproteobacteria bacterium]|nr:CDP-diacylglycerol--glycerol-3-phosphate 3-phosphatidyltransferase [Gammaproteobacteria bacterium]MAY01689.1 CDP-diacylglycerol--glycerol-3-phosphate 3-phosphatidyltransferase [Gammaproteobacteria bacterium]|tara:strand:- start:312 stop:890 length:579 start_codon:yes stop_codon:yes gene_type:complete